MQARAADIIGNAHPRQTHLARNAATQQTMEEFAGLGIRLTIAIENAEGARSVLLQIAADIADKFFEFIDGFPQLLIECRT